MKNDQKILNRVALIMNYDSAKTLYENEKDINIISEQLRSTAEKVAQELGTGLKSGRDAKGLAGAEYALLKNSLDAAARKVGYNLLRNDGTLIRGIDELEAALGEASAIKKRLPSGEIEINPKAISPSSMGALTKELLINGNLSKELKAFLIDDLTSSAGFIKKYKSLSRDEMKAQLDKIYGEAKSSEISDAYIKKRGYDKPPETAEEIAAANAKAAENTKAAENVVGKEGEAVADTMGKEGEAIADAMGKEVKTPGYKLEYTKPNGEKVVIYSENEIKAGEELLGKSSPAAVADAEKKIIENTVPETRPEVLGRFSKLYKIYRVGKKTLKFGLLAGAAGLIWIVIRKMYGPDAVPVDENGNVISEDPNAVYDPSAYDNPYDTSAYDAAPTTTTATSSVETDRRNQVAPQQAPTSSLSLTNIANDINKPQASHGDPNAVSPEMRASLINRIQNDKRYKGEDLEPNERAFVDQYIRSMSSRLPSKEKIKYQMSKPITGKAPSSEPVTQDIKYGYKQK